MENLETLALAKVVAAKDLKAARAEIAPGTYQVDTLVRVTGGVKVGEDYDQSMTNKVKPLDLFLAALDCLAPQVTDSLVARIVERALDESDESLRKLALLKERTEGALATVRKVTKSRCKGKVTTTLTAVAVKAEVIETGAPTATKAIA